MTEKPLAFLSLVKVLESAIGHKTKYALLEPFRCTTVRDGKPDIIPIQTAAKVIAKHVGLADLMFIISATIQEPTTAGHIELRYDASEVFVEISQQICEYGDAVLATLCHEISHKFLHLNRIRHGTTQIEQEFLTDVTAVYLGMGKIMLNGCECQSSYTKTVDDKTTTTTHTVRTGYISRQCFAFVYRLICEMRQIPAQRFLAGLSGPAREAVLACEQEYRHWFRPEYHTSVGIEALRENMQNAMMESQSAAAEHDYTLRKAEQKLAELGARLHGLHKPLLQAEQRLTHLLEPNDNPHLRYLDCVETKESVSDLTGASNRHIKELRQDMDLIEPLGRRLDPLEADTMEVIKCPMDQTKLRVPSGRKRLLVTCSTCKYKFMVNTATVANDRQGSRLLKSFKAAFGRK